jgi:hypothetical protein
MQRNSGVSRGIHNPEPLQEILLFLDAQLKKFIILIGLIGVVAALRSRTQSERDLSEFCTFCEFYVSMIEDLVGDGADDAEVVDSLDGLCEFMEESVQTLCGRMFRTMIPDITTQLEAGKEGHAICRTVVGACKDD